MKNWKALVCIIILTLCAASLAAENIVLESDVLKLVLHEQTGSYTLFRKTGEKGKWLALNDVSDNSSSTGFAVKMDSTVRQLRRSYDVTSTGALRDDGSAVLTWEVCGALSVEARFSLISSAAGYPADTLKVDFSVQNLDEREIDCSLKAVIDTVLGETSRIHFVTDAGESILTEKEYETVDKDLVLSTSNGCETAVFVVTGKKATTPDYILIANRDRLLADSWMSSAESGRSFDTLLSPNNSAIGLWYKSERLKMFQTMKETFFIVTSTDGEIPDVSGFTGIVRKEESASAAGTGAQNVKTAADFVDADALQEEISLEEMDYSYIQSLLDRIQVIEASDNPDEEEVRMLSAEIDALILELTR